ncbi:gamma-cysteine synthetase regulatory subunit [Rhizodiscina lignyota]|uniref:GCS light chain n=1 Tax=Rhizodiscina lignyota TaxID=1504668 RepID=A0A9P4INT6_9PEZI|nr:gamma-cysteine synthetase regulatory subunit [Rhizodiscina lignyota]
MRLVLSTSNIMGGSSIISRAAAEKSNTELVSSLRANFHSVQRSHEQQKQTNGNGTHTNGSISIPYKAWTRQEGTDLYIPTADFEHSGLAEERSQYDITVKLFYLPNIPPSKRCAHTREAIELVLKELHVSSIDLLIISFPGISFDADDEEYSDIDEEDSGIVDGEGDDVGGVDDIDTMATTWRTLEALHDEGIIGKLGLAEFGSQRLSRLLAKTRVRPTVDQINVRDCCVVPKQLILFAKQEGIELLTHNDCTNILPRGTLRELLGPGETGAGVLAGREAGGEGLKGDVEPQWVVKYTAVVKNRGVVENKGYFAAAELHEC